MKKLIIFSCFLAILVFACKKESSSSSSGTTSSSSHVVSGEFENLSDPDKLKFLSDQEYSDFVLNGFIINKINGKEILNKETKADFKTDRIDFSVRITFKNKAQFYTVADNQILISPSKKTDYISAYSPSWFLKGYFLKGKFYFTEKHKIG